MSSKTSYRIWAAMLGGSSLALTTALTINNLSQKKLQRYIIANAEKYVGIREVGDKDDQAFNDPTFEYKLRHLGWQSGWDWCAFFVKLVLMETFSQLKLPQHWQYVKTNFSPATQRTWANFRKNPNPKVFRLSERPHKGSVALWRNIKKPQQGHTGIVIDIQGNKFRTIEGNRHNDVGYMENRSLEAYRIPEGKLQLLGFINFKS